ncbi:MAG: HAD family hydrolase [Anaerolineaceae bacterium]|nr:HAD family hydrolase [Anaerolineaceae bacterium]
MDTTSLSFQTHNIEIINPEIVRGHIHFSLFDFDGTISLIREGWQDIMIPMMVELLAQTPNREDLNILESVVSEFVTRLTGKQTIYQMIQLCEEIKKRGGDPKEPGFYKGIYINQLNGHIKNRISSLKSGSIVPEDMMVHGALDWLKILKSRGVNCYLASGTDERYVSEEVELLGLESFFTSIHGAKEDYINFSKKIVIDQIITKYNLQGPEFAIFGDGFVEIEDAKAVGGIAVGLATNEKERNGVDEWKRSRLISAGADLIISDFRCSRELESYLFNC